MIFISIFADGSSPHEASAETKEEEKNESEEIQEILEKEQLLEASILESMTEVDKVESSSLSLYLPPILFCMIRLTCFLSSQLCCCPRDDDVLLYAIPVCGPHAALQHYKYKVKLTPGNMKRGRMAHSAGVCALFAFFFVCMLVFSATDHRSILLC